MRTSVESLSRNLLFLNNEWNFRHYWTSVILHSVAVIYTTGVGNENRPC